MPCLPAISSHSLGRAWVHGIEAKLDQASHYGLDIEMFYEDLFYVAKSFEGGPTPQNQIRAATTIRSMCDDRGIEIVCLQPFMHYEGLRDRQLHRERIEELRLWIQLAKALRTSIISVPSTCLGTEEVSGDIDLIVEDMREAADLAAESNIELAYESLAWGTYADTWDQAWEVVKRVDRSNFGICLDTFNIAGRVYADPTAMSRRNERADDQMRASLQRLVQTVDVKKVVYVQVVDAEFLPERLVKGHPYFRPDQHPRMSWSRNCRLFYGEKDRGAYLPVDEILDAILNGLGYEGYVSAELFNASLTDADPSVPEEHARRAAESWTKIVDKFGLQSQSSRPKSQQRAGSTGMLPRAQL